MVNASEWQTRAATLADAAAIAAIYSEGIADPIATFETERRSARQIAAHRDVLLLLNRHEVSEFAGLSVENNG
jgi:L-amino acid N-acyltransferase YncA